MDHFTAKLTKPATKAAICFLTGTALILACYAPAIAQQKENSRHDQTNSHRPAIVSYLA